jgi:class 3 adenylate cyclase
MTQHQAGEAAADERAVLAAIRGAGATWLMAEAISAETGIAADRVRRVLETTSADVIVVSGADARGYVRYSTRDHYRKTTSLLRRYVDALESS